MTNGSRVTLAWQADSCYAGGMKHVDLSHLVKEPPLSATMTVEAARRLAHDILDACERVDPTEEESEWERYAARQDAEFVAGKIEEMETDHAKIVAERHARRRSAAKVDDQAWRSEVMRMGLEIREPSPYSVQAMRGNKVFAEWWPSKGTTMHQQKRGPRCIDSAALVRWISTLVA